MMKTRYILAACAAALLLTGCFHEFHETQPGMGYIATALNWEQPEDAATNIEHIDFAVLGSSTSFSKSYASAEEAAADLLAVPEGEYKLLVTVNMTTENGYTLEGMPATKADAGEQDIQVLLKNDGTPLVQSWFGVSQVSVRDGAIVNVRLPLQRLLSPISLDITNLPGGATVQIYQSGAASSVTLTQQDADGRFGVPAPNNVGLQNISGSATYLYPTVSSWDHSELILTIITATGQQLVTVFQAPRVEVGKRYVVQFDYNELQPYMFLESSSIGRWEDTWTINGDILNPR